MFVVGCVSGSLDVVVVVAVRVERMWSPMTWSEYDSIVHASSSVDPKDDVYVLDVRCGVTKAGAVPAPHPMAMRRMRLCAPATRPKEPDRRDRQTRKVHSRRDSNRAPQ